MYFEFIFIINLFLSFLSLLTRSIFLGYISSVASSPNRKYIATGSWDKTVAILDVDSRNVLRKFNNIHTGKITALIVLFYSILFIDGVISVVFSPKGEYLATGSTDGTVNLIETDNFEEIIHRFDKE